MWQTWMQYETSVATSGNALPLMQAGDAVVDGANGPTDDTAYAYPIASF